MLSTTYFLTAISIEQRKMNRVLTDFQQHIQTVQSGISAAVQEHYFESLDAVIKNFYQIESHCHERKIDLYLIPAIDKSAMGADKILSEIEFLKSRSMNIFIDMQDNIDLYFNRGFSAVEAICGAMKQYCDIQQTILTKEKNELVPMAQQQLPLDVWFSISAKCLADQEGERAGAKSKSKKTKLPAISTQISAARKVEREVSNRVA